ncbi:STAS domain-containing protein [Pontibacter sp. SGAir0037]|uniref:STAS domain-containing protein n=1 Tax=Pontibacter sp. SGAir0037 TaxID=2571030 RepID=UPI0010CD6BAD|nr:STAS domain-containing protein [Pontibacter sp. SGAir0037]QCR21450.1 anti-sigma F factor antagonist [Pontibacter sp. SGAir0037]
MNAFKVEKTLLDNNFILALSGELDASSSVTADQAIEQAINLAPETLIIECSRLSYVSSAGLGVFLAAYQACQQKEVAFVFTELQPKIKNIFSILGLDKIFTITDTIQHALT